MDDALWYKDAVFYEVYIRAFYDSNGDGHGDLQGLIQKLDYLQDLGVDCLWLMPYYTSPLRDDGYDIADFYSIHPDYGTLDDFKDLLNSAHQRGLRVIGDLVLNHTSDQHPWFQAARANRDSDYRDYYVWSETDNKYPEARIIFVDTEKSNWTWDEQAGQYYWHRFYSFQPDLNYANPAVQDEMIRIMKFWLDIGMDGFRVDAVPYLFEQDGTNCENLPATHAYLKKLRQFVDENYPGRILLCEANQWPREVLEYFGNGDEFHMAFHFPLMPRIFMAIRRGSTESIQWVIQQTPSIPNGCQWCTFLRNHDELTLEMVTEADRDWMWREYAPDPRMRLNLGIRRRLASLLDNDPRKILLANSLLFSLPGSPIIYYGDEIGMGDNFLLPDRNGVRTPMQWDNSTQAGFTVSQAAYAPIINNSEFPLARINAKSQMTDVKSIWHQLHKMIPARKKYKAFSYGNLEGLNTLPPSISGYTRQFNGETLLILNNLTDETQLIKLDQLGGEFLDILTGGTITAQGSLSLKLQAFEFRWLIRVN